MTKRWTIHRLTCMSKIALMSMALLILSSYGCSYITKPEDIMVLPVSPMGNTSVSSYLPIKTLYNSDTSMCLIATWGGSVESGNHATRWEILDDAGKALYTSDRKDFKIRSHLFTVTPVDLDAILPEHKSIDQLVVNFYIDGEITHTKQIEYKDESISGSRNQQVIILPFIEENNYPSFWADEHRLFFQNTIADAIYCELKRVHPNTIPHFVAEQKVGRKIDPRCVEDNACASFLKDAFGEQIFIYGDLSIQKVDLDASTLTVYVYNMKTGERNRFHFFHRFDYTYTTLLHDLLAGVIYERGMLEYIRNQ